ncbi:DNA-binding protein [Rhizobium sp. 32-5/1]|uniref:helix-turn-helix transcriptional regulator n=1 Tax=Rhizobium sp. 32-5/1 TaxID=3019602 RepID=UPI00240E7ABE|nr:DNA-binding protein [Rhizobium sp. 32-5/1]WEZ84651.1 DNA-binding protein [Rhizobium sp. 32-5/1]
MTTNLTAERPKMRTAAAAIYTGASASTLNKLRLTGGGPAYIKLGKTVVYDPADLDAWLSSKRRRSTSVAA